MKNMQKSKMDQLYKVGEYMIWTDHNTYLCKQDTGYSPDDYSAAWKMCN